MALFVTLLVELFGIVVNALHSGVHYLATEEIKLPQVLVAIAASYLALMLLRRIFSSVLALILLAFKLTILALLLSAGLYAYQHGVDFTVNQLFNWASRQLSLQPIFPVAKHAHQYVRAQFDGFIPELKPLS